MPTAARTGGFSLLTLLSSFLSLLASIITTIVMLVGYARSIPESEGASLDAINTDASESATSSLENVNL